MPVTAERKDFDTGRDITFDIAAERILGPSDSDFMKTQPTGMQLDAMRCGQASDCS
jgi:hypothetical protein